MIVSIAPTPVKQVDTSDTGIESTSRCHFQWAHAAALATMLLDETEIITVIYREHHADILLKHNDGCYPGLQVKSRELRQPKCRTNNYVLKSCSALYRTIK